MEEDYKLEFDINAMIDHVVNKALSNILAAMMPNDDCRKVIFAIFESHRKHGIDTATTIKILTDMAEAFAETKPDNNIDEEKTNG